MERGSTAYTDVGTTQLTTRIGRSETAIIEAGC